MPTKPTLEIHPTPFKPSYLSIPPSPLSPQTPLQTCPPRQRSVTLPTPDTRYVPPPPLQWLWQCHQCRRTYSLGVTRRCLEDGHAFCAGTTTVKAWRRPLRAVRARKHRACASEFDYQGWKAWGRWKRSGKEEEIERYGGEDDEDEMSLSSSSSLSASSLSSSSSSSSCDDDDANTKDTHITTPPPHKDCWTMCDYPSECRWGKRLGVHTPVDNPSVQFPTLPPISSVSPTTTTAKTTKTKRTTPPPVTFEGILKPSTTCKKASREKTDFWGALVASATRRKNVAPSSPLANSSQEVSGSSTVATTTRTVDRDGDVIMGDNSDGDVTAPQPSGTRDLASLGKSSSVVSLKDIIWKGTKRRKENSKEGAKEENLSARAANGEVGGERRVEEESYETVYIEDMMRAEATKGEVDEMGKESTRYTPQSFEIGMAL